jgi:hypothetical protein
MEKLLPATTNIGRLINNVRETIAKYDEATFNLNAKLCFVYFLQNN